MCRPSGCQLGGKRGGQALPPPDLPQLSWGMQGLPQTVPSHSSVMLSPNNSSCVPPCKERQLRKVCSWKLGRPGGWRQQCEPQPLLQLPARAAARHVLSQQRCRSVALTTQFSSARMHQASEPAECTCLLVGLLHLPRLGCGGGGAARGPHRTLRSRPAALLGSAVTHQTRRARYSAATGAGAIPAGHHGVRLRWAASSGTGVM